MLIIGLLSVGFIRLGCAPSIPSLCMTFLMKIQMLSFVSDLFCIHWDDRVISFILLMWWVLVIDLHTLIAPCTLGWSRLGCGQWSFLRDLEFSLPVSFSLFIFSTSNLFLDKKFSLIIYHDHCSLSLILSLPSSLPVQQHASFFLLKKKDKKKTLKNPNQTRIEKLTKKYMRKSIHTQTHTCIHTKLIKRHN